MAEKLIKEDLKITDEGKLYEVKNGTWVEYEYVIFDKKKCYIYNGNYIPIEHLMCVHFLDGKLGGFSVRHVDKNIQNNELSNLVIVNHYNYKSTEEFIKECKKVYGDDYDYSNVIYITNRLPVCIKCNKCGYTFSMTPYHHLNRKHGCPNCKNLKNKLNSKNFVYSTFSSNYDILNFPKNYKNKETCFVKFRCKKCGEIFERSAEYLTDEHPNGICPNCDTNLNVITYEECLEESKKYKTIHEFKNGNYSLYKKSKKEEWLNDFNWLENDTNSYYDSRIFCIYCFKFPDNHCYVGLTSNLKNRVKGHNSDSSSAVYEYHIKSGLKIPEIKVLENDLLPIDAQIREDYWRNYFSGKGWIMLNKAKTGELSGSLGPHPTITKSILLDEIDDCPTLKDVKNKSYSLYYTLKTHYKDLGEQIYGKGCFNNKTEMSLEEAISIAKKCKNIKKLYNTSSVAYNLLHNNEDELKKIYPNSYKFHTLKAAEEYVKNNKLANKHSYPSWIIYTLGKYDKLINYFGKIKVKCTKDNFKKEVDTVLTYNTIKELKCNNRRLFSIFLKNGLLYKIFDEKTKKIKNKIDDFDELTKNILFLDETSKNISPLKKKSKAVQKHSKKNKHFIKSFKTFENAEKLAKECESRTEFCVKYSWAYEMFRIEGKLDDYFPRSVHSVAYKKKHGIL